MKSTTVPVHQLKQSNVFLTDKGKFELSPKFLAALLRSTDEISSLEVCWVKFKNTLTCNADAVAQIDIRAKEIRFIAKYPAARTNATVRELVGFLEELGFVIAN